MTIAGANGTIQLHCLLAGLLCVGLAFPTGARACSCAASPTPWEARAEAETVFSGTVISSERVDVRVNVTFEIDTIWEGEWAEQVTVQTRLSGASCGYRFQIGKSYLVYAYAGNGTPYTSTCTRTARLDDAQSDIEAFERLFLGANYPEPFRRKTTIAFGLPRPMEATLEVFDQSGRLVRTPVDGHLGEGTHRVTVDGSSLPGGVYYYRLQTEAYAVTHSMVLLR